MPKTVKYTADMHYGGPSLYRFSIVSETDKTITLVDGAAECVFGAWQYFGKRVLKRNLNLFGSLSDATRDLADKMLQQAERLRRQADDLDVARKALLEMHIGEEIN